MFDSKCSKFVIHNYQNVNNWYTAFGDRYNLIVLTFHFSFFLSSIKTFGNVCVRCVSWIHCAWVCLFHRKRSEHSCVPVADSFRHLKFHHEHHNNCLHYKQPVLLPRILPNDMFVYLSTNSKDNLTLQMYINKISHMMCTSFICLYYSNKWKYGVRNII